MNAAGEAIPHVFEALFPSWVEASADAEPPACAPQMEKQRLASAEGRAAQREAAAHEQLQALAEERQRCALGSPPQCIVDSRPQK